MEHLHLEWLESDAGSLRTKLLGAALGLIGGLLFGGVVLPSRFLTAPVTALAAAAAAIVAEQWLARYQRGSLVPVRCAWIGGTAGLGTGAILGLVMGAGYSALAFAHGAAPLVALQGLFTMIEIGAISGLAGLLAGFCLGVSDTRR